MLHNKHIYTYIQKCLTGKMKTGKEYMGLAERVHKMVLTYWVCDLWKPILMCKNSEVYLSGTSSILYT